MILYWDGPSTNGKWTWENMLVLLVVRYTHTIFFSVFLASPCTGQKRKTVAVEACYNLSVSPPNICVRNCILKHVEPSILEVICIKWHHKHGACRGWNKHLASGLFSHHVMPSAILWHTVKPSPDAKQCQHNALRLLSIQTPEKYLHSSYNSQPQAFCWSNRKQTKKKQMLCLSQALPLYFNLVAMVGKF